MGLQKNTKTSGEKRVFGCPKNKTEDCARTGSGNVTISVKEVT